MAKAVSLALLALLLLAAACGSDGAAQPGPSSKEATATSGPAPTPTQRGIVADKRTIKPDDNAEGSPIAKAGTPAVAPFPSQIGTCKIEDRKSVV